MMMMAENERNAIVMVRAFLDSSSRDIIRVISLPIRSWAFLPSIKGMEEPVLPCLSISQETGQ